MATPERNLDAYRTLGDILTALRVALRTELEKEFGPQWFAAALPAGILNRLVERKEKEKAVNAFDDSYYSLLEYADFEDLKEICLAHPTTVPFLKAFGGNRQICLTRFMELQGLHEKLAGLRTINKAELSFLQHLVRRLHQTVDLSAYPEPDRSMWAERPDGGNDRPRATSDAPAPAAEPASAPAPAPQAPVAPVAIGVRRPEAPSPVPEPTPPAPAPPHLAQTPAAPSAPGRLSVLEQALQNGEDKTILAALLTEVRQLSEHITDSQGPTTPPVLDMVSESPWYARRYAALGMRPMSDFYNLYLALRERLNDGAGNQELESFLQAHAYQQVMMAVGVFFQQNKAL